MLYHSKPDMVTAKHPFVTDLSDNDIVPNEVQEELIYWRDQFTAGYFRIGDIANATVAESASRGVLVSQDRIHAAIGRFVGKSGRTIRYYAETSSFYPPEVRTEYDELPFSTFVLARSRADWQGVLDFALEHITWGVDRLKAHFENEVRAENNYIQVQGEDSDLPSVTTYASTYSNEVHEVRPSGSGEVRPRLEVRPDLLAKLVGFVESGLTVIERLPLSEQTKADLGAAIDVFRRSMPEIMEAVRLDNRTRLN